ncbi:MAG: 4Fe-4S binding protein [Eubacteriales bacterium]|nr:4Fe-4S binding protein [Eubacteriales bacterium]
MDTMSTFSISVRGQVRNIGKNRLSEIFEKNPYMAKIYPTEKSRDALEVFQLYKGEGEYFDLGQMPPFRQNFSFGGERQHQGGYRINEAACIGCQSCRNVCPVQCISNSVPRVINEAHCLHCGNCFRVCPVGAVEKLGA